MQKRIGGTVTVLALGLLALLAPTGKAAEPVTVGYIGAGGMVAGDPSVYAQVDDSFRVSAGAATVEIRPSKATRVEVADESGRPVSMRVSAFATNADRGFVMTVCDATSFVLPEMRAANEVTFIPLAGACTAGIAPIVSAPTRGTITITS